MNDEPDIFAQRLLASFVHLSKGQQAIIQQRMEEQGIRSGLKSGIARLVGIRTPSMLSDMLAGRVRGTRYRSQLANLLGVNEAWLMGEDDAEQPEWMISPDESYQRLCRRLRRAWAMKRGQPTLDPSDPSDDDSRSDRVWLGWLQDEETAEHARPAERELLATALGIGDEQADWLAAGRYERVDFDLLIRCNAWLGLAPLTHPDHTRIGHRTVQAALAHQAWVEREIEERIERYALPGDLFELVVGALGQQRNQLLRGGSPTMAIDDCLELLWRQQLRRQHGMRRPPVPAGFVAATGRPAWSDPRTIHNRSRARGMRKALGAAR